jgi:hypothetical protein
MCLDVYFDVINQLLSSFTLIMYQAISKQTWSAEIEHTLDNEILFDM